MAKSPIPVGGGTPISPKQFARQWQNKAHKFEVNVWNFEVKVGKAAQDIFKKSFDLKRFNSNGASFWRGRSLKSSSGYHPLMVETGSLKNSIKWKHQGKRGEDGGVTIYTDPNGFNRTNSHRGFCYAEVHNSPYPGVRRGRVKNMPQRQFMGHSSELENKLNELSAMIFKGFPI